MRTFAIVMVGLLIVSACAFATSTRTHVMGNNDMIMVDDGNIFRFAGRINNYPDLAMGEFDQWDDFWSLGVTWKFAEERPWVLGTFISEEPDVWPETYFGNQLPLWPNHSTPEVVSSPATLYAGNYNPKRVQLMLGHKLGGQNFGFSAEIVRISEKWDQDSTTNVPRKDKTKQSFNQFTFGVGLTEATAGKWDVGLSFMMGSWTDTDTTGVNKYSEPSGYYDLTASGRYFWVKTPKITLVPHATVGMGKRGAKYFGNDLLDAADDTKEEWSSTGFDLGCGMNYVPAADLLAVVDFGFSYLGTKVKDTPVTADPDGPREYKWTSFTLPYMKLGFEGKVFNWLDVRAGGTATLWSDKDKYSSDWATDYSFDGPNTNTYLGFGMNFGKLYLDGCIDPQILLDGPNFISGSDEASDLNYEISMIYELF
jgi:hypothetical protein